jgi:hypothetical protein
MFSKKPKGGSAARSGGDDARTAPSVKSFAQTVCKLRAGLSETMRKSAFRNGIFVPFTGLHFLS